MITLRKANARGHANHGWLESWHSFSFADYQDPAHIRFGALRVINEDIVQPGAGFDTHGHRDMEIITCILSGRPSPCAAPARAASRSAPRSRSRSRSRPTIFR